MARTALRGARRSLLRAVLATTVATAGLGAVTAHAQASGTGKAKGDPIVIGIYTPADNPTFTAPELIDGAEAATKYVNSQLAGVAGKPIKLETCKSDYTAPGLTSCANKLFQKNPAIIIPGPDAAALTVQSTFDQTGIPLIGGASFTPPEYTSKTRAVFNGFSASLFPAMVHFAVQKLHAKKLTALSVDDPSNQIIKSIFMDPIAETNGLPKPEYVAAPAGSTDLTSTFAAALDSNPDALLPFGLPCQAAFQAYQSLGTHVPMIMPDNCADSKTLKDAGNQADGVYFVELFNGKEAAPKNKDVQLYDKQMKKYAKGVVDTDFSRAGFGTIMNIHALLDSMDPSTLSNDSILAAFKGTKNEANFLNTPYSCAAPPLAQYPAICAGSAYLMRFQGGKLKKQSPFVTLDVLFAKV
jgi:branched-chain amino acid transport system substrate-binding protein